jgi:hypothetical protein
MKDHETIKAFRTNGRKEKSMYNFSGKLEGQSPPRRPRSRIKNNIKMDLKEIGYKAVA